LRLGQAGFGGVGRTRPVSGAGNSGNWEDIGRQGFLDAPPPNPNVPELESRDAYHRKPGFWPGLVALVDSNQSYAMTRKSLPYEPITGEQTTPSTDLPSQAHVAVFDNTFLLGLRNFAWTVQERFTVASGAQRGSGPPQALPGSKLALTPKPWPWGPLVTRWRPTPPVYKTFGEVSR